MNNHSAFSRILSKRNRPRNILIRLVRRLQKLFKEEFYLKILFRLKLGKKLDLQNPKTFNEKLQWLKLNYRRPEQTKLVDRYEAKRYVGEAIGNERIIPTYGIWNTFDEVDFNVLPNQFVLKTTPDSGGVVVYKDKRKFDGNAAKIKLNMYLERNYYDANLEWAYKNVKPRVIAEEFMTDGTAGELNDYKFLCFNGKPELLFINIKDSQDVKRNFYDMRFNHLDITQNHEQSRKRIEKPEGLQKMVNFAQILSEGFPHVRVDFYNINGKIYFGEFTFYHDAGFVPFYPEKWRYKLGEFIPLQIDDI